MAKGLAIVCVTNNLVTDQRAHKHCEILRTLGFIVILVGRNWPNNAPLQRNYQIKRFSLWVNKGVGFYALYNIYLFFYLLSRKSNLVFANDLDTLPAVYFASLFRSFKIVFDAHEYFTGVPEIQHKPLVKRVWLTLENWIVPKIKYCITVNQSLANLYKSRFNKEFAVVRNVPMLADFPAKKKSRADLNIPENSFVVILQGAGINVNRGAEELILSLKYLDENIKLIIVGWGDVWNNLVKLADENNLNNRVRFIKKLPYPDMLQYTYNSNLGVSLDKPGNPNYDNSLPNKIFDYLYCGIPVLAGNLKEPGRLINTYRVGMTIDKVESESIANAIHYFYLNQSFYESCKQNTSKIREQISWEKEYESIKYWF